MKYLALLLLACSVAFGQSAPQNIYAAGVSYNGSATPHVAGTALYARGLTDGTYMVTVFDALPISKAPFTVQTQVGVGIAQKLFTVAGLPVYSPNSVNIAFNGTNTGWAWNTGFATRFAAKKGSKWYLMPTVRVNHSSVSSGSGYQPIIGLLVSR